ncbi:MULTISPECIES: TetR/AcrR family transcriptional regulator [unclassified Streptomyces]|uniref:TetR/AcrR family transcriptional regulator n=1 Tax=unclassified Streptomyces TaxID=2593676 RepID=UPI003809B825
MPFPRKRPRQQRSRETVAAILEGAAQIFEREGYERTTTNRVAERAGVSIGTLYQYFPNKDALLWALGEEHVTELARSVEEVFAQAGALDLPLDETVGRLLEAFVASHAHRPLLHRVLYDRAPRPGDTAARLRAAQHGMGAAMAAHLVRLGLADPALAGFLGQAFVQGLEAQAHGLLLGAPAGEEQARRLRQLRELWTRALTVDGLDTDLTPAGTD